MRWVLILPASFWVRTVVISFVFGICYLLAHARWGWRGVTSSFLLVTAALVWYALRIDPGPAIEVSALSVIVANVVPALVAGYFTVIGRRWLKKPIAQLVGCMLLYALGAYLGAWLGFVVEYALNP